MDTSVWPRCDAECSPERGYYYHPSRHSAGQPIVAGWAYQFVAQLNFVRESWTAPLDVERVLPAQDANEVAAEQVKALLDRLGKGRTVPLFVFDAGYDPVKVQQGLEGSPCQILLRLRAGRRFYGDPSLCDPPEHIGGPRRHGPKMKCSDPRTWPEPSAEHRCEDAGYGCVRVRAWAELHPKVHNHAGKGTRGPLPIVVGTLILVEVERLPRGERRREPRVLWLWWHGPEGTVPDLEISSGAPTSGASTWSTPSGFSSKVGMERPSRAPPRAGRPLELAGRGRLYTAKVGARPCGGPQAAVGAALRCGSPYAGTGLSGGFVAFGADGHAGEGAETLREVSRETQRQPLRPRETLPGDQKGCLSPRGRRSEGFCDGDKAHRKTPHG